MLIDFRERGEGRSRETPMRETNVPSVASYAPQLGTEPIIEVCALTGSGTCDLLVYGMVLQPTEPHWPGFFVLFFNSQHEQGLLSESLTISQH